MPYVESPYFETPCQTETLWRYMTIDKFMYMLSEESLYFPNITLFDDRYEGSLSDKSLEEVYKTNFLNEEDTPKKQDEVFFESKRDIQNNWNKLYNPHPFESLLNEFSNRLMFCNCWFQNDSESYAMWGVYGDKGNPTSIAIQTTISDLINSIDRTGIIDLIPSPIYNIHIGEVKYRNYKEDHIIGYEKFTLNHLENPGKIIELFYAPITHKRDIYKEEKEIRATISFNSICKLWLNQFYPSEKPSNSRKIFSEVLLNEMFKEGKLFDAQYRNNIMRYIPIGIPIKIDLQTLIKRIVLSPNAKGYFDKALRKFVEDNNIDPKLVHSSEV